MGIMLAGLPAKRLHKTPSKSGEQHHLADNITEHEGGA
jgi:hypothetical protein